MSSCDKGNGIVRENAKRLLCKSNFTHIFVLLIFLYLVFTSFLNIQNKPFDLFYLEMLWHWTLVIQSNLSMFTFEWNENNSIFVCCVCPGAQSDSELASHHPSEVSLDHGYKSDSEVYTEHSKTRIPRSATDVDVASSGWLVVSAHTQTHTHILTYVHNTCMLSSETYIVYARHYARHWNILSQVCSLSYINQFATLTFNINVIWIKHLNIESIYMIVFLVKKIHRLVKMTWRQVRPLH